MKIRKVLILGGLIIVLGATLVGCGAKEKEVKSVKKENDTATINIHEQNKETNDGKISNVNNSEVYKVDYSDLNIEDEHYIIIHGYDNKGNTIWEYKTQKEEPIAQFSGLEYIADNYEAKLVVINRICKDS